MEIIKDSVLEKIQAGEISMRSKMYFKIEIVLLLIVTALVFVISVILVSFVLFAVKVSGQLFLLGFGFKGVEAFFLVFPWRFLLLDLVLLLAFDYLLRRFKFGYRSPLLLILVAVFLLSGLCALLIDASPLHDALLQRAEKGRLPVLGSLYDHLRKPVREMGLWRGIVVTVNADSITLVGEGTTTEQVMLVPDIDGDENLHVGDEVFIAGTIIDGHFYAYGIRKIESNQ